MLCSQKSSSDGQTQTPSAPNGTEFNGGMVYEGAMDMSSSGSSSSSLSTCSHVFSSQAIAGAVAVVAAIWQLRQLF